jgi:hypothetical protein
MATNINTNEIYFEWWLDELKNKGLVISYLREPESFKLYEALNINYEKELKTKTKEMSFNLFREMIYTPDYLVRFDVSMSKFFGFVEDNCLKNSVDRSKILGYTTKYSDNDIYVYFDCKPTPQAEKYSNKVGSSRDFKFNKRLLYEKHNLIVNKVIPCGIANSLYCKTFLPTRYRFTDKSGALRKLKPYDLKTNTLEEWLRKIF